MKILLNLVLLLIGFLSGLLLTGMTSPTEVPDNQYANALTGFVTAFSGAQERSGPKDRVLESAIAVYGDRVVLDIQQAQWSTFTDTNSMDPVLDQGANAIQIVPQSADEIEIGDIISYEPEGFEGIIIHRVVDKGEDEQGVYFIAKGDNLPTSDPGRIRFEQIKRVVIAIIY